MELPRGCQYWNNDEVRFMIEGTESTIHDFDGCCYGLRQRYGESNMYIKKPWRIVSWNVELGNKLSSKCDGRHEHAPCAGRETLHTQIYTSKIVSIILEEQYRRSVCVDRDSIYLHTDGSSGQMSKRCAVAASCTKVSDIEESNHHVHPCPLTRFWRRIRFTFRTLSKKSTKEGLRWNTALSSEKHQDPNSGSPPTGAIGAARAGSTGGHKTCSVAMAASGSHTRPQAGGDGPQLFVLDEIINGIRYLKATGEIMKVLIEEEKRGNIILPTRFGDGASSPDLVERWASLGIPLVLLIGIRLGEVATDKDAVISSFKRIVKIARSQDMSLELRASTDKIRRICQAASVATEAFIGRGETQDLYSLKPILDKLSTARHLRDSGPGLQNLFDAIKSKGLGGTIGELVGVESPQSYLNRDAPLYRLRRPEWYQIFNHGMQANPAGGIMHSLDSLLNYVKFAREMLHQVALCIRVYNYEHRTIDGKLTVAQVADDVHRLYSQARHQLCSGFQQEQLPSTRCWDIRHS